MADALPVGWPKARHTGSEEVFGIAVVLIARFDGNVGQLTPGV